MSAGTSRFQACRKADPSCGAPRTHCRQDQMLQHQVQQTQVAEERVSPGGAVKDCTDYHTNEFFTSEAHRDCLRVREVSRVRGDEATIMVGYPTDERRSHEAEAESEPTAAAPATASLGKQ